MKNKKVFLILGIGAIGLYAFYRYRKGLSIFPSFGGTLAGQGTAGSGGSTNGAFVGQTNLPQVPVQTMSESERIRLRNLATGPSSRGQCLIGNGCRWIDTQTAPYYGIGVNQATFTKWMNAGYTFPGDSNPTLDFVKRALGLA
jgi:hypothetical protein